MAPLLFLSAILWPLAPSSRSGDGLDVVRRLPVPPCEGFRHLAGVAAVRGLVPALGLVLAGAIRSPAWGPEFALHGGVLALVALGLALAFVAARDIAPGGVHLSWAAWGIASVVWIHLLVLAPKTGLLSPALGLALGVAELMAAMALVLVTADSGRAKQPRPRT